MKELVLAQVDRLPVQAQVVVKTASVLGARFEYSVLIGIYPGPPADVDRALDSDAVKLLLVAEPRSRATDDKAHAWQSTAVRDIVYNLMLLSARQRLHLQAAEFYERVTALRAGEGLPTDVGMSARHSCKVGQGRAAKGGEALTAGRAAIDGGDYADGENWLDQCRTCSSVRRRRPSATAARCRPPPEGRSARCSACWPRFTRATAARRPKAPCRSSCSVARTPTARSVRASTADRSRFSSGGTTSRRRSRRTRRARRCSAPRPRFRRRPPQGLQHRRFGARGEPGGVEPVDRRGGRRRGRGRCAVGGGGGGEVALAKVECHFLHSLRERERAGRPWLVAGPQRPRQLVHPPCGTCRGGGAHGGGARLARARARPN